ncbi:probable G-protein coupled receptor No18 [Bemisia tabaci]|uniref:probable G-protein coupled receptor No18 n=1 Tax=Bemisia tabaci TaxID=7038 RepID=UPI0008F9E1CA|nr:PREDICTED: octopamine receptor 1-like [Bemisia tabaci]
MRTMSLQEYFLTILFCIFITVTVVGNTLIITAVLTTRRLRTVTNCFVMSLAVADFLVGIFVMPLAVAAYLMGSWELGWLLCDIWISLDVCLCTASILSLCAISVDRYFAVTEPLNYSRRRRSKRLAACMILIVWLMAFTITCPPIFGWYDPEHRMMNECTYNQNQGYVVFSAMGSFFIPLVVMVYVYTKISCVIAQRHNHLEALSQNTTKNNKIRSDSDHQNHDFERSDRESSESEDNSHKQNNTHDRPATENSLPTSCRNQFLENSTRVSSFKRESKTAQTLSVVVGGFIACWLPFFIVYLINPFLPKGSIPPVLMACLTWLGWINSAINPFIYAFYSPDFRLAFWRLTLRHCTAKSQRNKMFLNQATRQSVYLRSSAAATPCRHGS